MRSLEVRQSSREEMGGVFGRRSERKDSKSLTVWVGEECSKYYWLWERKNECCWCCSSNVCPATPSVLAMCGIKGLGPIHKSILLNDASSVMRPIADE